MLLILLASGLSKGRGGTGRSGSEGGDDRCRGEFGYRSTTPGPGGVINRR